MTISLWVDSVTAIITLADRNMLAPEAQNQALYLRLIGYSEILS